ncbi:MAG: coenzyme F420 hydrogenase/dehydrogenase beta subunit N-terminal domain-containing protein [Victivallales bacterium]
MSQEGFRLLQRECINSGLCYECGLCASVCPAKAIELKMYDWGRNPELIGRCTDEACTRCYDVCAAKLVPVSAMEKRFFGRGRRMDTVEKVGGVCRFVGTGCAVDPEIREIGVSGGVATSLMIFALEKGYVDGCVLAGWDAEKPWLAKAYVATSKKDVIACSGSKYQPHPQLLGIREAYEMGLKKIAVSATPCHAQSLRKMMMNEDFADISGIIRLISCNFCAAHWALAGTKWLLKTWLGVDMEDVREMNYRTGAFPGTMRVRTKDGRIHEKAFVRSGGVAQLGRFTPEESRICLEKVGYAGDVVFGDTWCHPTLPPNFDLFPPTEAEMQADPRLREAAAKGLSAIVARSEFGLRLLEECRDAGRIRMFANTGEETEKFLTGVASEKPTWYGPWIDARKHRGMPVREYI